MWSLGRDLRLILLEKAIEGFFILTAGLLEFLLIQAWLNPLLGPPRPAEGKPQVVVINNLDSHLPPRSDPTPKPPVPPAKEEPPEITVTKGGEPVGTAFLGTCGEVGKFRTVVFSDVFNWAYRETATVELNGKETDFREFLQGEGPQKIMATAEEIVAVGTSSCEGLRMPFRHDVREENRAQERADQLGAWIQEVQPTGPDHAPIHRVHTLSLGRFQRDEPCNPENHPETRDQRKVILVAVMRRDPALGLEECLKESFSQHEMLKPLVTRYSKFDLDKGWTLLQTASVQR